MSHPWDPVLYLRHAEHRGRPFLDLRSWRPEAPVDVLVSNAALQWVPGHLDLVPRLVEQVAAGGWLALQVPDNADRPTHTLRDRFAAELRAGLRAAYPRTGRGTVLPFRRVFAVART